MTNKFNGVAFHKTKVKPKNCVICNVEFIPKSGINKFCSPICKGKWKYFTGKVTTKSQYKEISGNWERYLSRLLYSGGRKRDGLTRDILMEILKSQNFKCALSGIDLTCNLEKGKNFKTNVSIDRIKAGGPYSKDNIQLVCRGLNSWRSNMSIDEFIWYCQQVVNYQKGKNVEQSL